LEAKAREAILLEADSAIYARRNAAVENERAIKQSELDTEVAIEQKKRVIRETQMDAEASVQRRKAQLREEDLTANIQLEDQRKEHRHGIACRGPRTRRCDAHRPTAPHVVGRTLPALRGAGALPERGDQDSARLRNYGS
jgi:hypothetical protein